MSTTATARVTRNSALKQKNEPVPQDVIGPDDVYTFSRFYEEIWKPKGLGGEHALRWALRHRKENGLSATGAVIEKYISQTTKRPTLYIIAPRFFRWMATSNA